MGLCFRAGIPKGPPLLYKNPPGSAEDGASWSQVCGSLPACRAVPYARQPRGESGLIRPWSPPGLRAGPVGIKRAGISAGGWGLIAATREAAAAAHPAQVPCCRRCHDAKASYRQCRAFSTSYNRIITHYYGSWVSWSNSFIVEFSKRNGPSGLEGFMLSITSFDIGAYSIICIRE